MAQQFFVKQVTVDPVTWTPIQVPEDCNVVSVENSEEVDLTLRTTVGDATTERLIPAGTVHRIASHGHGYRFGKSSIIYHVRCASGVGPAIVEFM